MSARLILDTEIPPPVDFQISMIEAIDGLYQIDGRIDYQSDLIAADQGYLSVSKELVAYWGRWLGKHTTDRRIGINWQGNPGHHADIYRSVPLAILEPLSRIEGVTLVNLQFGFGVEQLETCGFGDSILRLPDHVDATERRVHRHDGNLGEFRCGDHHGYRNRPPGRRGGGRREDDVGSGTGLALVANGGDDGMVSHDEIDPAKRARAWDDVVAKLRVR